MLKLPEIVRGLGFNLDAPHLLMSDCLGSNFKPEMQSLLGGLSGMLGKRLDCLAIDGRFETVEEVSEAVISGMKKTPSLFEVYPHLQMHFNILLAWKIVKASKEGEKYPSIMAARTAMNNASSATKIMIRAGKKGGAEAVVQRAISHALASSRSVLIPIGELFAIQQYLLAATAKGDEEAKELLMLRGKSPLALPE